MEKILTEWEAFAGTLLPAAGGLTPAVLRDHAQQILQAIATDLNTPQSRKAQAEKSQGRAPIADGMPETAAQTHAVLRARIGFDINQLVAEYRALRASVLRKWMDYGPPDATGMEDMVRFNEAIDQAIAESVGHFNHSVERYRNLLLGMLGHDLRNPLNAIVITAQCLARLNAGDDVHEAAEDLIRSGASMQMLLDDLTDFNRINLGLGLKINPADIDLNAVANDELGQFRAAHPDRHFELAATGNTCGRWDGKRVQQMLRNLVANAVRYGMPTVPIRVAVHGSDTEIRLEVTNAGHLDPNEVSQLFDPLKRGSASQSHQSQPEGLGLGLFIVREIARAHGGNVNAHCTGDRTTFAVDLPRAA